MQVIRLVSPGRVDKVIAFDSIPKSLMKGVRTIGTDGYPRHWKEWLTEVGSVRKLNKWIGEHDVEVEEPCFHVLEFITLNKDKERWQEIVNYVRKECDSSIRLLDKFEDMAAPLSQDSYQPLSLEPEAVPIIPLKKEVKETIKEEIVTESEPEPIIVAKRRGRPPRQEVLQT